jgi:hypothetical protein
MMLSTSGAAPEKIAKSNRRGERLIAFGWYGGKFHQLDANRKYLIFHGSQWSGFSALRL